jgi:holo-[acyl-carrier protein] synthase
MIIGNGCDIVQNCRIANIIDAFGERFLQRIYTAGELEKARNLKQMKRIGYLAKRFAAKEAIAKALGCGIGKQLAFKDIEIVNDEKGKPIVTILSSDYQNVTFHLSMADEKHYSIASVVAVGKL